MSSKFGIREILRLFFISSNHFKLDEKLGILKKFIETESSFKVTNLN